MARRIVQVRLMDQSDGRGVREEFLVDTHDQQAVLKALRGKGLGLMGGEIDDSCVKVVDAISIFKLRNKFPKPKKKIL